MREVIIYWLNAWLVVRKKIQVKLQDFFLKTLVRQVDVQREIHIHIYLANNSVKISEAKQNNSRNKTQTK